MELIFNSVETIANHRFAKKSNKKNRPLCSKLAFCCYFSFLVQHFGMFVRLTTKRTIITTAMRNFKTIAIALLASILLSSCVVIPGKVSQHKTEVRELNTPTTMKDFCGISVAGAMNVVLNQGDKPSVLIKSNDKEILDKIVIYIKDNTLNIETKKKFLGFNGFTNWDDITIYVTAPTIESLELAGSGNITTDEPIDADNVNVEIAGSGDIDISGGFTCNTLDVEVAGSGNVSFDQLKANRLRTSIAGSGNVSYNNMNVINVSSEIAGSGNIIMKGKASHHSENVLGSGNVDISGLTQ